MSRLTGFTCLLNFLFLTGCAVALVPESRNPKTKIDQASILFNKQGRPVGAVTLLNQAVVLAKEQMDKNSEAIAEFYLAEIYKSPGHRGKTIKSHKRAIEHYTKGIKIYDELKYFKWSAFLYWNKSGAYGIVNKLQDSCTALKQAEVSYKKPRSSTKDVLPAPFSGGNLLKSIRHNFKKENCK